MSYRRPSRSRSYYSNPPNQAMRHVQAYNDLERRLGPLLREVQAAFFHLPPEALDQLLTVYQDKYGFKSASYARETMPLWQSGGRKMSGQTMERLLDLVPRYLSTAERYELVASLCNHYQERQKIHRNVVIDLKAPQPGLEQLRRSLGEFEQNRVLKAVPEDAQRIASWLSDNDATVARHILAQVDQKMTAQIMAAAQGVERTIRELLEKPGTERYQEVINFPTGQLTITASKPSACFIANEVYGDPQHHQVVRLRRFRDERCLGTPLGDWFVLSYYQASPAIAAWLRRHPRSRRWARAGLSTLITIISRSRR